MSKSPRQQQRAAAKADRHDAHIWRMSAAHRANTPEGRAQAAADRAHAQQLDQRAARTDPDR